MVISIAGISVASPSINNFDDFVYQLKEPFDGAEPEPIAEPEPERNPIPEGDYVDNNMYVYSIHEAESYLNYTLGTPYLPEGERLEKIKISSDKRKATIYYTHGLEVSHHPMGINFNNTHYKLDPEREEGKVFYDFRGTFAEGYEIDEPNRPYYSVITIHRDDRICVRATMETGLDELLKMIEPMDLNVPHVPYTPTLDYVMGAPEPEPIPEPEPEHENFWTASYGTSHPTVMILRGAVLSENQSLDPKVISVVLGKNNTIVWVNGDDLSHGITSDNGDDHSWGTGTILPGESASVIFNQTGVFEYHGMPHPWITGKVIVLEK